MDISLHNSACWDLSEPQPETAAAWESALPGADELSQKFNRIFSATKDRLYQFVWKLTQNETDTKDIIQNCYLQLWQKIDTVDDSRDVLPLVFTYARNAVIDHLRKKTRQKVFLRQLQTGAINTVEQQINYKEAVQQLQTAVDQLPSKRKEIFMLVKEEGLSHKMAAAQLGISPATVEKQVGLSLKFLRKVVR